MKAVLYAPPGPPEVLRYADMPDPAWLIRVEAIAIEGGDLINRASSAPPDAAFLLGYATAGVIIAVGADVADRKPGQRVTSFDMSGLHAGLRAVAASRTWLVPEGLAMNASGAPPIAFGTAHHCLFARGGLKPREALLVQAGAGAVGVGRRASPRSNRPTQRAQPCSRGFPVRGVPID